MSWRLEVPLQWRLGYILSFWMMVLYNIGPGVGIRILALLMFFCYELCRLSLQATVANVCLQGTWRRIPSSPGSPPCTVGRQLMMAVRLNGIWFLIVILISICPVIIWDTSILSLAIWVLFFYFFFLKGVREIDLWNWLLESWLCLEFISVICVAGLFLRAAMTGYDL